MKKRIIAGVATVGIVGAAGVAWAALSGSLIVPDVVQGVVQGSGSSSCQNIGVTFTVPDPTWDATAGDYAVQTVGYSGITSTCVTLGTADLTLTVTQGATVLGEATASNMGATSGTLTFSSPIPFDDITNATYNYIVKDA